MFLECIEENVHGQALYGGAGFQKQTRLVGYELANPSGVQAALEEIAPREVALASALNGESDLPFEFQFESLATLARPGRAYRLGAASCVITDPEAEIVRIHALVVEKAARRRGEATKLMRGLFHRHPDRQWKLATGVPEGLAPSFFDALGFSRTAITQWHMIAEL